MTRDKALAIADRIMARVEIDRAIHRDAIADEVIAAMAVQMHPFIVGVEDINRQEWKIDSGRIVIWESKS